MDAGKSKVIDKTKASSKISIGILVPLVIGVSLIFSGSLAANSYQDEKQRQSLEAEAANLTNAVNGQSIISSASKDRLKETQERLEKASNFFPAELTGSVSLQAILTVASNNNVQVINIQENPPTRQIVGENIYYAWPFSLKVEGALQSLLKLIIKLERQETGPLVLQKVKLNKNKSGHSANLDLVFYTRSRTEAIPKPQKPEKSKG